MKALASLARSRKRCAGAGFAPCLPNAKLTAGFAACLVGLAWTSPALAQNVENPARPLRIAVQPAAGTLEVAYKGQRLLLYAFATNQFKPYVKELYTLKGDNVLLDSPPDHLHHHGLMYAIRVNGINFWEEAQDPGVEKPLGLPSRRLETGDRGVPRARISQKIHWVATKDRGLADTTPVALLVEQRTLTLAVDEAQQEVALRWHSDFAVGQGAPKVTLAGASYHGLGLRLTRAWDHVAKHQNSENTPYSAEQKGDVTPARWSAVSHTIDGRDLMVVLFGRPTNKGEARFFTMLNAFAYVSATQNLEKVPLEYVAGDRFSLDYLVTVYAAHKDRAVLEERYQKWQ